MIISWFSKSRIYACVGSFGCRFGKYLTVCFLQLCRNIWNEEVYVRFPGLSNFLFYIFSLRTSKLYTLQLAHLAFFKVWIFHFNFFNFATLTFGSWIVLASSSFHNFWNFLHIFLLLLVIREYHMNALSLKSLPRFPSLAEKVRSKSWFVRGGVRREVDSFASKRI